MPFAEVSFSADLEAEQEWKMRRKVSKIISEATGKAEDYIMVVSSPKDFLMGGKDDPAAFVDIRSIGGLTATVCRVLSEKICEYLDSELDIPSERVYLTMEEIPANRWGWNSRTFG